MSATPGLFYPLFSSSQATRSLTVDSTVGGVQMGAILNPMGLVFFDVQDADVMMTTDGATAPTSSVGHRLPSGTNYTVSAVNVPLLKFIRQGSTNARIQYSECAC